MNSQKNYKGIILAGGSGKRLAPLTNAISKQLIPVYNKPMIYYPLSTLMIAHIKEFLIITNPEYKDLFMYLLGDGSKFGIDINYAIQEEPNGLAEAFLIGSEFIGDSNVALILGDNLFHGSELELKMKKAMANNGATIFVYRVKDPERYGVVEFDSNKNAISLQEKPKYPKSNYAITGLYFYDNRVVEFAKQINPSNRGELEITSINQMYLSNSNLKVEILGRGTAWLDTGTFDSLAQASSFIKTIENRQGLKIGCLEEISWRKSWINDEQFKELAKPLLKSGYGEYFLDLLK